MTKQLAFDQFRWNRRTVHFDKRSAAKWAFPVNVLGKQFFACSRFSLKQNAGVRSRDARSLIEHVEKGGGVADHLRRFADDFAKPFVLALKSRLAQGIFYPQQYF